MVGSQNNSVATPTPLQQTDYSNTIGNASVNAANTTNQQNQLNSQLQNEAAGNGAVQDLTQAQLLQASAQAQQQAAGSTAAQKGMNPALMARQILQNNANIQQQNANQSAINKGNLTLQSQNSLSNNLAATQQGNLGTLSTAGGLQNQQNSTAVQQNVGVAGVNAGVSAQNANTNATIAGGLTGGAAGTASKLIYKGGEIKESDIPVMPHHDVPAWAPKYDAGGSIASFLPGVNTGIPEYSTNQGFGSGVQGGMDAFKKYQNVTKPQPNMSANPIASQMPMSGSQAPMTGGQAPMTVDSTPSYLSPEDASMAGADTGAAGADAAGADAGIMGGADAAGVDAAAEGGLLEGGAGELAVAALSQGGDIKGPALVPGNSPKNDVVPAWLSPGEIVIPRSITQSQNAPALAAQFVAKEQSKNGTAKPSDKAVSVEKISVKPADKDDQSKVLDFIDHLRAAKMPKDSDAPKSGFEAVLYAHQHLDKRLRQLEDLAKQLKRA